MSGSDDMEKEEDKTVDKKGSCVFVTAQEKGAA
jgi:hypothetical protein